MSSSNSAQVPAGWWGRMRARLAGLLRRLGGGMDRGRRVPALLQSSAFECGAACLAMILSYYGRSTRVAECHDVCGVGRDGVSARSIAQAARQYGLRVRAVSVELDDCVYLQLPAIIHWNFNHFVVLERWSPAAAEIVDPAIGRRRLTAAEFDAGFTGVALMLSPGDQFAPGRAAGRPLWLRYFSFLLQTPGLAVQILCASILLQLIGLALPAFTRTIVDQHHDIAMFRNTNILTILGIGMLILMVTQAVTSYLRSALLIFLQARIDQRMMLGFFEHLLALPFRFFQQRPSGDLLMRLGSNATIREVLTTQMLSGVLDSILLLTYLVLLFFSDAVFGAIVLGAGLLQLALFTTTPRMRDLLQRDLMAQAESQNYLVEALSGMITLKSAGAEDRALDHWSNLFAVQLNVSLQRSHLTAITEALMSVLRTFSPIVLLWIGTQRVLGGAMSLGTMFALNVIATAFLTPLSALVSSGQRLQLIGVHFQRLADILEAEVEQDPQAARLAPPLNGRIEVRHVSFRYDPRGPLALEDISFSVAPGQKIALVGRTGSGKSTLARLLLGLYSPTDGELRYDDIPLHSLVYRSVRAQCGVVLQESQLFRGSIRQNIAFHDPQIGLEQVMEAARLAAIHDEIMQLPMGYETLLTEGGSALSGGQRQRLALARALAHRPAILLLDEATSHLDAVTEALVDQHVSRLACTRIIIAHRLSTIRGADLILVLDRGRLVERGTHEQLLAQGGYYTALAQNQLATAEAEAPGLETV